MPVNVRWYGERGILNALVTDLAQADDIVRVRNLLHCIEWPLPEQNWIPEISSADFLVELGLSDFGNPDLIIVCRVEQTTKVVFVEAKTIPYSASAGDNRQGIAAPGYNSTINGQLSLKFRFAHALAARDGVGTIQEPDGLHQVYCERLQDPIRRPRQVSKEWVTNIFRDLVQPRLDPVNCFFVAVTPDVAWNWEGEKEIRPMLLDGEDGADRWETDSNRCGWTSYSRIVSGIGLQVDSPFVRALSSMNLDAVVATDNVPVTDTIRSARTDTFSQPTQQAVEAFKTQFTQLMQGIAQVNSHPGSVSIECVGRVRAKIIPRAQNGEERIIIAVSKGFEHTVDWERPEPFPFQFMRQPFFGKAIRSNSEGLEEGSRIIRSITGVLGDNFGGSE